MNIHFIAIGGSAMHNLALALHDKGYFITGSDDVIFEPSKTRLETKGLLPEKMGWFPDKITQYVDAVILGMHAKMDNPELMKAKEMGLKIYSYPEFLYEQSKSKTRVVIGGSHGKTTITAMVLHVMKYHAIEVDYMVGALLEGFDTMVHLTEQNDFIVLEGDEYLSSPLDKRPKFHLYKPTVALLSGISWDHINVFPTYKSYVEQFEIFIEKMVNGGVLIYNEEDEVVRKLADMATNSIRKIPYKMLHYKIENATTFLDTPDGFMPIHVFGKHNISNLSGAKWVCQIMGVDEVDFFEAIATFKGASKRLEKIAETPDKVVYKDFAHSPSKVKATTLAVREQYKDRKLIVCLELHTYSSLDLHFIKEYGGTLDGADEAIVYYSPDAVKIKELEELTKIEIEKAFHQENLVVFTDPIDFKNYLFDLHLENTALLLMSSGNYGGLDFDLLKNLYEN